VKNHNLFSIWTQNRTLLSDRVTKQEIFRLRGMRDDGSPIGYDEDKISPIFPQGHPIYNQVLIYPHPRSNRKGVWIVSPGVSDALVLAELRRDIERQVMSTEANQTMQEQEYATDTRAGRLYWHRERTCTHWHPDALKLMDDPKFRIPHVRINFKRHAKNQNSSSR
jgi:hypothetical protein